MMYLQNAKFFVMASFSEGLPTAMMQAMSCGVIPITNLVGNIPDIVRDKETGFVFNALNENEIVNSMDFALQTEVESLNQMKANCRNEIVIKHSHNYVISKWKDLLEKTQS